MAAERQRCRAKGFRSRAVSRPAAEREAEYVLALKAPVGWRHADVIPAVRVIAVLLNLLPGHTNVRAIFATLGLPKTIAKADFGGVAILAVAAGQIGTVGHHPGRIELLMNHDIGGR